MSALLANVDSDAPHDAHCTASNELTELHRGQLRVREPKRAVILNRSTIRGAARDAGFEPHFASHMAVLRR